MGLQTYNSIRALDWLLSLPEMETFTGPEQDRTAAAVEWLLR